MKHGSLYLLNGLLPRALSLSRPPHTPTRLLFPIGYHEPDTKSRRRVRAGRSPVRLRGARLAAGGAEPPPQGLTGLVVLFLPRGLRRPSLGLRLPADPHPPFLQRKSLSRGCSLRDIPCACYPTASALGLNELNRV